MPAGVEYLDERTVGASLGSDSIKEGMWAGIAGVIAVVFVMLVYYKKSGINATLALILNAMILVAALSYFGAVLTLPGIAGIILTIGMAVDSNVLIFERIREELRAGKAVIAAVDAGFSKAFLTIIDTHVTTDRILRVPVPVRNGSGAGIRGDAGDRVVRQRIHGGFRVADDFRLGAGRAKERGNYKYLKRFELPSGLFFVVF